MTGKKKKTKVKTKKTSVVKAETNAGKKQKKKTIKKTKKNSSSAKSSLAKRKGDSRKSSNRKSGEWTLDRLVKSARQFATKTEWATAEPGAYSKARESKSVDGKETWFDTCTSHMEHGARARKWNKEKVMASAKKYSSRYEWYKGDGGAYQFARQNNFFEEAVAHMDGDPRMSWTLEILLKIAKRYSSTAEWRKKNKKSFSAAYSSRQVEGKEHWFDLCTKHMVKGRISKVSLEACLASARRYSCKEDWKNGDGYLYRAALNVSEYPERKGWFQKCIAHMDVLRRRWTLKELIASARKYKTINDWKENESAAYLTAERGRRIPGKKKWYGECTKHMK